MKHRFSFSLVCAALAAALLFGLFGDGQTVNAQVGECPAIASLQPGAITNATESTLLITGTGFDGVELVVLRGYSSLAIDADRTDTKLRVTVPAGVCKKEIRRTQKPCTPFPFSLSAGMPAA